MKQSKNQPRLSLLSIIGKNITLSMKRKEPGVTEFVNMTIDRRVQSSRHVFTASATAVVPKEFIAPAKAVVPKEFIAPAKAVVPKQSSVAKALEVFPCYSLGRVYIHLDTNAQHSFQLHRAVLERQSTWFANEFARTGSIKEASRYRFFLTMSPKHKVALLVQTVIQLASLQNDVGLTIRRSMKSMPVYIHKSVQPFHLNSFQSLILQPEMAIRMKLRPSKSP